jgi:hypothetical protein
MCSYAVSLNLAAVEAASQLTSQLLSLLKLLKPELRPFHDYEETIFKLVS